MALALVPEILDTPERQELRRVIAEFLSQHLPDERVRELDEAATFPRDVWRQLSQIGIHGLGIPEELGGSGGTLADSLLVTMELARHFPSLGADWILVAMTGRLLLTACTPEQQRQWLPGLVSGEEIFAFGMSEPSGGTDVLAGRTRGRLDGDTWRFSGQKLWTSMADHADWIFLLCRTEREDPDHRSRAFSLVAVPIDQPGIAVRRVALSGMRAASTCEVFIDGAEAPAANLVGDRGRGFHVLRNALVVERLLAAGISLGIGRGALEEMVGYAGERTAFGRPIGAFQAVQHPIADSAAELSAALCLAERVALADEAATLARTGTAIAPDGDLTTALAAMAKLVASEAAARIVDRGMRIFAAAGLAASSRMQRYFRDARLQLFSPISNEMIKNLLGECLGLPRSY